MTDLRQLLEDFIVYGDEKGWVEYTDAGVWVTDKGVAQIQKLLTEARIEERLKIYQMKESIRPSWFLHDKELQKRIKQLKEGEV